MSFGDTLRLAYQQASEIKQEAAKRVASGMDWVGKQSDAIASKTKAFAAEGSKQADEAFDWLSHETDVLVKQAHATAHQVATKVEHKAQEYAGKGEAMANQAYTTMHVKAASTAHTVKAVYQKAKKTTTDAVVGTAVMLCNQASHAKKVVTDILNKGLENATKHNRENMSEWEIKGKGGVEADRRKYMHAGKEEPPGAYEPKAEVKVKRTVEKDWLRYGDDDTNVKVGVYKSAFAVGYEHDFNENRDIYGLWAEKYVAGVSAQTKGSAAKGLVDATAQGEVLSAKASGMLGYVQGKDFIGVKAEIGAEANLIKGTFGGQINLTPKTVYDNTLGRAVGLVKPEWGELPAWADHGLFVGAEGELGIGAAAKGVAQVNVKAMSVKAGGLIGAGPMAGIYATFGIK